MSIFHQAKGQIGGTIRMLFPETFLLWHCIGTQRMFEQCVQHLLLLWANSILAYMHLLPMTCTLCESRIVLDEFLTKACCPCLAL